MEEAKEWLPAHEVQPFTASTLRQVAGHYKTSGSMFPYFQHDLNAALRYCHGGQYSAISVSHHTAIPVPNDSMFMLIVSAMSQVRAGGGGLGRGKQRRRSRGQCRGDGRCRCGRRHRCVGSAGHGAAVEEFVRGTEPGAVVVDGGAARATAGPMGVERGGAAASAQSDRPSAVRATSRSVK